MPQTDQSLNQQIIRDFRANDGQIVSGPFKGAPLLLLHTRGAKTGEVVTLPAQIWHWHGASADTEMQMLPIMHPGPIQWQESPENTTAANV